MSYIVICQTDSGHYRMATSRLFDTEDDAKTYAATIHPAREPKIMAEVPKPPEPPETTADRLAAGWRRKTIRTNGVQDTQWVPPENP